MKRGLFRTVNDYGIQNIMWSDIVEQDVHYYRHLAMIFPSRSQLASKQITRTGRAEAVTKEGIDAPSTSARSNGTTSSSTASMFSIAPGSVKERVLCISTRMWALPLGPSRGPGPYVLNFDSDGPTLLLDIVPHRSELQW